MDLLSVLLPPGQGNEFCTQCCRKTHWFWNSKRCTEQPPSSRGWGGCAGDERSSSELPVQSKRSLPPRAGLPAPHCCGWCQRPNSYWTQQEQDKVPSFFYVMRIHLIKGPCSWVCSLLLFSWHAGKCLLKPLRSDLCRYIQLLFSLISEAVVNRCCSYSQVTYLVTSISATALHSVWFFAVRTAGRNCVWAFL